MGKNNSKATGKKDEGILSLFYDFFRSIKLTIFLLIFLAILSIIGTIIPQNASRMEYIQRYGSNLYNLFNFFDLFDMYHSWWFSGILLLLSINLISCSIHRLPSLWNQIFREREIVLKDSLIQTLPFIAKIRSEKKAEEILTHLRKWFRKPKQLDSPSFITFYGEKGRFSRLGVYITHLSVLIILIGSLIGSIFGFRGFVNIFEGETVNQIYLREGDRDIPKPIHFSVRCDEFNILYYDLPQPEKHVKDYLSVLTIIENEREILKKTIKVNHPLHYKGLSFYQSSYGSAHQITLGFQKKGDKEKRVLKGWEGENIPLPQSNAFIRVLRYVPEIHHFGEGIQIALFKMGQEPKVFWVLKGGTKGGPKEVDGELLFTLENVTTKEYTGLQVTKDPGVWIVWVGCGLMIFGLILSFFFSHQRVWIRIPKKSGEEILLAGTANKNRIGFEKKFDQLTKSLMT
jgi:cytochrome c biogenesis protein